MARLFFLGCLALCLTAPGGAQAQTSPSVDWSGFYIGADLGGALSTVDTGTTVAEGGTYFITTDFEQIADGGHGQMLQWRPAGRVHGGYAHQFGHAVLGIEVSAGSLLYDNSRSATFENLTIPGSFTNMKQSVTADWVANMLARAGWGEDRWLAFVTGGLAVTRLEIDYRLDDGTAFEAHSRSSEHEVRFGWTLGLGGEYAFDERWSIRGQYLYTNFGTMRTVSPVISLHANQSDLEHSARLQTHTALIGVSYRF